MGFQIITRFAPAPTGFLHLGHVVNAIYVWGTARGADGCVVLRIEDHDRKRGRPEYEQAILEDLDWLGFAADEGPARQRERGALYEAALERLRAQGFVYACECSRSEITVASPDRKRWQHLSVTLRRDVRFGQGKLYLVSAESENKLLE